MTLKCQRRGCWRITRRCKWPSPGLTRCQLRAPREATVWVDELATGRRRDLALALALEEDHAFFGVGCRRGASLDRGRCRAGIVSPCRANWSVRPSTAAIR